MEQYESQARTIRVPVTCGTGPQADATQEEPFSPAASRLRRLLPCSRGWAGPSPAFLKSSPGTAGSHSRFLQQHCGWAGFRRGRAVATGSRRHRHPRPDRGAARWSRNCMRTDWNRSQRSKRRAGPSSSSSVKSNLRGWVVQLRFGAVNAAIGTERSGSLQFDGGTQNTKHETQNATHKFGRL